MNYYRHNRPRATHTNDLTLGLPAQTCLIAFFSLFLHVAHEMKNLRDPNVSFLIYL
jgi:hypothetical protein